MATFFKRKWKTKTTYGVQIRRKGFKTLMKSFDTKTQAQKWAVDWYEGTEAVFNKIKTIKTMGKQTIEEKNQS